MSADMQVIVFGLIAMLIFAVMGLGALVIVLGLAQLVWSLLT